MHDGLVGVVVGVEHIGDHLEPIDTGLIQRVVRLYGEHLMPSLALTSLPTPATSEAVPHN